jgi:hypothetical protein
MYRRHAGLPQHASVDTNHIRGRPPPHRGLHRPTIGRRAGIAPCSYPDIFAASLFSAVNATWLPAPHRSRMVARPSPGSCREGGCPMYRTRRPSWTISGTRGKGQTSQQSSLRPHHRLARAHLVHRRLPRAPCLVCAVCVADIVHCVGSRGCGLGMCQSAPKHPREVLMCRLMRRRNAKAERGRASVHTCSLRHLWGVWGSGWGRQTPQRPACGSRVCFCNASLFLTCCVSDGCDTIYLSSCGSRQCV